jgi:GntR family transcriptional regulator
MTTTPRGHYQQVADHLRHMITSGQLAPGQMLPSESTLADQFDLSRLTINRAMGVLVGEGLVTVLRGRGTFVREHRPLVQVVADYVTAHPDRPRNQWRDELARQGFTGRQELLGVGTEQPTSSVAGHLHLNTENLVVARHRLMLLDDEPNQLADSYYPASLAAGTELALPSPLRGGTVAALERLGHTLHRFEERIRARMPTAPETHQLRIPPGTPVLEQTRVTITTTDERVEVTTAIMRGDVNELAYTLPARHDPINGQ